MPGSDYTSNLGAIAVTGNIGSGKSKVSHWLGQSLGLPVYSADVEVRNLLNHGKSGWVRFREILGENYFDVEGRLNKPKLREDIFADSLLREKVEHHIHPLVLESLRRKTADFTASCLVEVPLLFEANWQRYFAKVLVVYADDETCLRRVVSRDRISAGQAMAAFRAQNPIQKKISLADFSVDNSGNWEGTVSQLEAIIKQMRLDQKNS